MAPCVCGCVCVGVWVGVCAAGLPRRGQSMLYTIPHTAYLLTAATAAATLGHWSLREEVQEAAAVDHCIRV